MFHPLIILPKLPKLAPTAEIYFERLAVIPEQIAAWNLPSRPTKQSDSRAKSFGADRRQKARPQEFGCYKRKDAESHRRPERGRLCDRGRPSHNISDRDAHASSHGESFRILEYYLILSQGSLLRSDELLRFVRRTI